MPAEHEPKSPAQIACIRQVIQCAGHHLFRRRFLEALEAMQRGGQLQFFGEYARLNDPAAFAR